MPRILIWLALPLVLLVPASAISPHQRSLSDVLRYADWVAVATVLTVERVGDDHGSGLEIKVRFQRTVHGIPPAGEPVTLVYWEAWPSRDPSGKTEAPIWSGSSLERSLSAGDQFLAIGSGCGLERAEPLVAEGEISRLLRAR